MKKLFSSAVLAVPLLVQACASAPPKSVEMKMAVEVLSDPAGAPIRFRGKPVGDAPQALTIASYADLGAIDAQRPDLPVVEKRVRILSPD